MKKTFVLTSLASLLCVAAQAQVAQPSLPPGKIAILKAGTSNGVYPINSSKVQPIYVQVFDPVTNNQTAPLVSVAMATNSAVPGSVWINAHAGSEGGGISRSIDRQFLALGGYTGNILSPTAAKPSAAAGVERGIVTLDAFTNAISVYSDPYNWFGLPNGVTQNNPTGLATTDGTNFWGTGNVTGTSSEASGILYYNANVSTAPVEIENYIQAAAQARIIGGTLYVVVPGAGVYNFLQTSSQPNPGQIVPLPWDPSVPVPYQTTVATNMFLPWGSKFANVANFDMNASATIAYGADEANGIVKFTNNAGPINPVWVQAPYYFSPTNLGTLGNQTPANSGCFGICVDFSGLNPVIYATTMENGTSPTNNAQGNPNQNRLIRIVDNGNPGTNIAVQTLATAPSINEAFRGIDFTPDLTPLITSEPASVSTTNGGTANFSVGVQSVYALNYQWLQTTANATNYLSYGTNATLTLSNLTTTLNGTTYQCIVSNAYGVVTSAPPASLAVTILTVKPSITNAVAYLTNYIGNTITLSAINPNGTQPFTYQWYQGGTPLSDVNPSADGATYSGSTNNTLTITGLGTDEIGNYYLAVTNAAGGILQLVDVLSVQYQLPVLTAGGQPQSVITFTNLEVSLTASPAAGTQPFSYQWYHGTTQLSDPGPNGEYSGSQYTSSPGYVPSVLTINPVGLSDAGNYYVVISNGGGSVTSQVATVSVIIPPAPSFVAYSNQVYIQNFDSLPDPGASSQNSFNNGDVNGSINGVAYSLSNPFDFAYPVITSDFLGGLGLAATMSGWYGAATTVAEDSTVTGYTRFGAQDGDQTTGGIIDFGPNDNGEGPGILGTNRALGLLSTGTTGSTTFALKLINDSGTALNYVNVSFLGEMWHNGTGDRTMSFGYTLDNTADTFELDADSITNSTLVTNMSFSFPTAAAVTTVDGTNPTNQVNLSTNNLALGTPWQPNAALWLIWSINYYGAGSGNGYAIDNLSFSASVNPVTPVTQPSLSGVNYSGATGLSFSFTNTPGAALQFTIWSTTNLALPFTQWKALGHPSEISTGNYQVNDPHATNLSQQYYRISSP